jgi:hypothetical protein
MNEGDFFVVKKVIMFAKASRVTKSMPTEFTQITVDFIDERLPA